MLTLACAPAESPADAAGDTSDAPDKPDAPDASLADSAPLPLGSHLWYDRSRIVDVTGDGRPDTLQLIARGTRSDSLYLTLLVRSNTDSSLLATWRSEYDLVDPTAELQRLGPVRDSIIRARYDRILDRAVVEPYADTTLARPWSPSKSFWDCEDNAHHCVMLEMLQREYPNVPLDSLPGMPFDTAAVRRVVADLAARRLISLTYSYGYESTETVVWSPVLRHFIRVAACC